MSLRILIIGGVAGGMSAATRARRMNESASITVLEKGGFISFANCGLPYYLAGRIQSEETLLVTTPAKVRERFNLDVRVHNEALRIDRQNKQVEVLDHLTKQTYTLPYDKLILAPGANAIIPPIANVDASNVFLLRSMEDARRVHAWMSEHKPKSAAIIGAGFIGLEMTEALHDRGLSITLIEKAPQVLPPLDPEMASPVAAELEAHHIQAITGTGLKSLHATNGLVNHVEIEDGRTIWADMVLLSIGVRPNSQLAHAAGLVIGPSGAIVVDAYQRTNDPDIYAVGDAAEVIHGVTNQPTRIPLAGPANRQGRLAGERAATGSSFAAANPLGTAIVQVFDLSVGMTGLSERTARQANLDVDSAYVFPAHHASYYPGSQTLRLKLLYENKTGRILGAQILGTQGVDKRIDVIATTIHHGGTVDSLASIDLAYAPQFSSAKDPVHIAAMVAQNQRRQLVRAVSPAALGDEVLLDLRTPAEFAAGSLPHAINIPVDDLRSRLEELDPTRPTIVFCQAGQRGYVGARILTQHGFTDVRNLKGGYLLAAQFHRN